MNSVSEIATTPVDPAFLSIPNFAIFNAISLRYADLPVVDFIVNEANAHKRIYPDHEFIDMVSGAVSGAADFLTIFAQEDGYTPDDFILTSKWEDLEDDDGNYCGAFTFAKAVLAMLLKFQPD